MSQARSAKASRARVKTRAKAHPSSSARYLILAAVFILVAGGAVLLVRQNGSGGGATAAGAFAQVGRVHAADYHSLTFSPSDPNTILFGHHNGIMQSSDGGKSWKPAVDRPNFDAMILGANPAAPNVVWMAGHNVFYRSTDGGQTWNEVKTNLPGLDIHAFAVGATDPNSLYAFAVGFGLFKSTDGGVTWQPLGGPRQPYTLAAGGSSETLYVGTDEGVVVSLDGGVSFAAPVAVGGGPVGALAAVPNSDVVYAGSPAGLYRSDDGGRSWSKTGYSGGVAAVAVQPTNPQRVVLVDGQGKVFGSNS